MVGAGSGSQFNTRPNSFNKTAYQDSISAESALSASFYSSFHTFGVDWSPGESLKWYIDGTLVGRRALPAYAVSMWAELPARQQPNVHRVRCACRSTS